jgi:hypothetical protein
MIDFSHLIKNFDEVHYYAFSPEEYIKLNTGTQVETSPFCRYFIFLLDKKVVKIYKECGDFDLNGVHSPDEEIYINWGKSGLVFSKESICGEKMLLQKCNGECYDIACGLREKND